MLNQIVEKIPKLRLCEVMLGLRIGIERYAGTAGNSEWMDVSLGKVPNVTADLIRKAFYPADEHVADAAAAFLTDRRFLC